MNNFQSQVRCDHEKQKIISKNSYFCTNVLSEFLIQKFLSFLFQKYVGLREKKHLKKYMDMKKHCRVVAGARESGPEGLSGRRGESTRRGAGLGAVRIRARGNISSDNHAGDENHANFIINARLYFTYLSNLTYLKTLGRNLTYLRTF